MDAMRDRRSLLVVILLVLMVSACSGTGRSGSVKIAVAVPQGLAVGQDALCAIQLALDENDHQAGSTRVELIEFDTSDLGGDLISPERETVAAQRAVADPSVVAYIGALTSDQAKASMPILNQASIAQISPTATWPGLTKPGFGPGEPGIYFPSGRLHFFRTAPSDDVQGVVAARWAQELGFETVYIVDDGTSYGKGIAGIFQLAVQDLGLTVLGQASLENAITSDDFLSVGAFAVATEPDVIFYGGGYLPKSSRFLSATRGLAPVVTIMGPDGLVQEELIKELGSQLVEGIYATNIAAPARRLATAEAILFQDAYQVACDKEPPFYALGAYEASKVILTAIEQANEPTRAGVLEAMRKMEPYSGVLGNWQFDIHGDISLKIISGMQIQDGAWVYLKTLR